ncbi:hypothetical protein [Mesonia aestuariivivens]|uniref:Uncharacterized protein n=1 Tax=Mesonia aestuariivivens TaxID=2796128 RepID=A0ABS6W0Y5_9FLAO|nr:hypothetical protein [Mesonia aestuariivivens]MBW2961512.1 hypothetical protein [Mesonia aestuariivivens]
MNLFLTYIENQLQQRLIYPYEFVEIQYENWSTYANFIYDFSSWDALVEAMKATIEAYGLNKREFFNYAANRWFNYWSTIAIEQIFTEVEGIIPSLSYKNRLVDFNLRGIDFSLNITVFPEDFKQTLYYAQHHQEELLYWMCSKHPQQEILSPKNRLFVIAYSNEVEPWKLKAEISWLKTVIQKYVSTFDASKLEQLQLNGESFYSAIIWAVK